MYRFQFKGTDNINQFEELIKVFLQPSEYVIGEHADYIYEYKGDKDEVKRRLYADLAALTGKHPKWGILTGIRPVKLASELALTADPYKVLTDDYYLHESKAALTTEILDYRRSRSANRKRAAFPYTSESRFAQRYACTAHSHRIRCQTVKSIGIWKRFIRRSMPAGR